MLSRQAFAQAGRICLKSVRSLTCAEQGISAHLSKAWNSSSCRQNQFSRQGQACGATRKSICDFLKVCLTKKIYLEKLSALWKRGVCLRLLGTRVSVQQLFFWPQDSLCKYGYQRAFRAKRTGFHWFSAGNRIFRREAVEVLTANWSPEKFFCENSCSKSSTAGASCFFAMVSTPAPGLNHYHFCVLMER